MFKYYLKYYIISFSTLLVSSYGYGQNISKEMRFTVDFVEGCEALDVIITPTTPCPCNIYFDGGRGIGVDDIIALDELSHTISYANAGIYNLIVVHESMGRDSIEIVVNKNTPPEFIASSCTDRKVEINITDTNYDSYSINYGDSSPEVVVAMGSTPPTYAYATANSYAISVKGVNINAKDNCIANTTSIQIVDVLADAFINDFSLSATNDAILEFTIDNNVEYYLEIQLNGDNSTDFQRYLSAPLSTSPLSISDNNLNFDANFYCFRIATFDPCDNTIVGYSNTLCSIDMEDIVINNLENFIQFNTSGSNLFEHEINRDGDDLFSLKTSTTHSDNFDITCNTEYCYKIISRYIHFNSYIGANETITSTSLTRCAVALSLNTPTQIMDISIDATGSPILSWSAPIGFVTDSYQISTPTSSLGSSESITYTDSTADPSLGSICYQIGYVDECGNTADQSNPACSIFLSDNTSNGVTILRWTSFMGWNTGVLEYQLIRNGTETVYTGIDLSFELSNTQDIQKTTYQIIAVPNDGLLSDSKSNTISITNLSNLIFPNAFVVNGTNGEFKVVGRYIVDFDLKIYTRWGELIAHIIDHNTGWDGRNNGSILPEGNYIYAAEIVDEAGNVHQRNGTVLLVRK